MGREAQSALSAPGGILSAGFKNLPGAKIQFTLIEPRGSRILQFKSCRNLDPLCQLPRIAGKPCALIQAEIVKVLPILFARKEIGAKRVTGVTVVAKQRGQVRLLISDQVMNRSRRAARCAVLAGMLLNEPMISLGTPRKRVDQLDASGLEAKA